MERNRLEVLAKRAAILFAAHGEAPGPFIGLWRSGALRIETDEVPAEVDQEQVNLLTNNL